MNRIFEPGGYIVVPDGTEVSPFLNASDLNQQNVPWGALGEMSIAAGRGRPGRKLVGPRIPCGYAGDLCPVRQAHRMDEGRRGR